MKVLSVIALSAALFIAGCDITPSGKRVAALDDALWGVSSWISVPNQKIESFSGAVHGAQRAASGTSWFVRKLENASSVKKATWMTAGLGVYELYVNGKAVGEDFLKPGFTHNEKTKYSFTYDVTDLIKNGAGESNFFAAEVSAGWWRDKIVNFFGKKSAFRSVIELEYDDGTKRYYGTNEKDWTCGIAGSVTHAAIFDGEEFDSRIKQPYCGADNFISPEINKEFKGSIFPTAGAEIVLRKDLALDPVEAYCWKGVTGETKAAFGAIVKTRQFADPKGVLEIVPGETLIIDFAQNCSAVPAFIMEAAEGTVLTCLPSEMLNDNNGERQRGNDGPGGSAYRLNLRVPNDGMRAVYTFSGKGVESYMPRFTFFGYRYVSITATSPVKILKVKSIPVTSVTKEMETASIVTGDASLNRFIANVYWGQLSNYLSVPTDCPQRNERLGWTADTQVFCETGSYNADTRAFFRKWMRDMRDTQHKKGGYPGVAPKAQYGSDDYMRVCWSDAGIVVPYEVFKLFNDTQIVKENWASMEKYMDRLNATRCENSKIIEENRNYQWADWLSFEDLESCSGRINVPGKRERRAEAILYWDYLYACYWALDADMMAAMAKGIDNKAGVKKYTDMAKRARAYICERFIDKKTGELPAAFADLQTANVMALVTGILSEEQKAKVSAHLKAIIEGESEIDEGGYKKKVSGVLKTGFLGSHFVMDALTENGMADLAYTLLLSHKFPSWLYSVDQGATTIWERWNGYVKDHGFGPVGMNSFNHYAYGQVLSWVYRTIAGIAADPASPGFKTIIMKPIPDRRLGFVKCSYKSVAGEIKSEWKYEGDVWVWTFTVPEGAVARVTLPGETSSKDYTAGTYTIKK